MSATLVSLVTPSYNQGHYIDQTIRSVLQQSYPHIEYWIIDGSSNDGTLEILNHYQNQINWVSEPDTGQVDAINKGLARATGTIYGYVNCDDLLSSTAIEIIVDFFNTNPAVQFVYGDVIAIDEKGKSFGLRANVQPCDFSFLAHQGNGIVQPGAFWRKELWQTIGRFDPSYNYVFDYDYWIRVAKHCRPVYIPITLAYERIHSSAKTSSGGLARIDELEHLGCKYGNDGVAAKFRPEASAVYIHHALLSAFELKFSASSKLIIKAVRTNNSLFKLMLYLVSMLLFGESAIPKLRLYSNQIRNLLYRRRRNLKQ